MKTATLPPIRIEPALRDELQAVLKEGESISSFTESVVRAEIAFRKMQAEFLARGRASLAKARRTGKSVPANDAIASLDKIIEAKFGPGTARKIRS